MSEKKIKVEDLPPYPGGGVGGCHLGFAFKDGKRYKLGYGSVEERAHCETGELCDQGLWEEAWEKLGEYEAVCRYRPDERLQSRVLVGLNKARIESGKMSREDAKEAFMGSVRAIQYELYRGNGDQDEIAEKLCDLIEERQKYLIPEKGSDDDDADDDDDKDYYGFKKASIEALLEVANAWLLVPTILEDQGIIPTECVPDAAHDTLHVIIEAIAKRKEFVEARALCKKVIKADPTMKKYSKSYEGIFQGLDAECAEAMGDTEAAHKAYKNIPEDDFYGDGSTGAHTKSMIGNLCSSGTLSERIARTQK